MQKLMYVEGLDGQVELTTDRVMIHRKGFFNIFKHGLGAHHEIPLSSISGIDFHDATMFTQGYIDFDHPGKRGGKDADKDKVKFGKKHREQFELLKEEIFRIIEEHSRH